MDSYYYLPLDTQSHLETFKHFVGMRRIQKQV